jgi:hypothetical protein
MARAKQAFPIQKPGLMIHNLSSLYAGNGANAAFHASMELSQSRKPCYSVGHMGSIHPMSGKPCGKTPKKIAAKEVTSGRYHQD